MGNRFVLNLLYDGSNFHGWQTQKQVRTVQDEIEKQLSLIHQKPVGIVGAGRTDAKVHATDQYAHFDSEMSLSAKAFQKALNSLLPNDIYIKNVKNVSADFHARYQAFERCYHYWITTCRSPFLRSYSHYVPKNRLFVDNFGNYTKKFQGKHDFFSFSKYNPDIPNTICDIKQIRFFPYKNGVLFSIRADRFLHNMVRRIVGAILTLSAEKADPAIINDLFEREQVSSKYLYCVPPQGLYLVQVKYPNPFK